MGIKHRWGGCNAAHHDHPNGSRSFYDVSAEGYESLAKVENCPCEDGVKRTAHATAEADTFFSVPACIYVGKKTVGGFLASDDDGWRFVVVTGTNAGLVTASKQST